MGFKVRHLNDSEYMKSLSLIYIELLLPLSLPPESGEKSGASGAVCQILRNITYNSMCTFSAV